MGCLVIREEIYVVYKLNSGKISVKDIIEAS